MRSLWSKIGLGALGVFAVGMLLITLGRQAKAATQEAIASAVHHAAMRTGESAARADMGFVLNGNRIGRVQRVQVSRAENGGLPDLHATVVLTDPAAERALADCQLEPEGGKQMDIERGFRCALGEGDRVVLGEVRFEPAGFSRRVVVTHEAEAELRQGEPFSMTADLGGKVQIEATGDEGKLVRLLANARGANIQVNDEFGRNLVRLLADSTGAMLRVRDEHGRDVVKMQADKHGFSLTVDTAGQ
jgi:hypothetical protein